MRARRGRPDPSRRNGSSAGPGPESAAPLPARAAFGAAPRAILPPVLRVETLRGALAARTPSLIEGDAPRAAAVAMILNERAEVLFIERARHEGDPWSGHMAFPGGRVEADDSDARAAAERETREEVGLSLAGAELLGRLDDKRGNPLRHPELVISAFVYLVSEPGELRTNYEVEEAFWFPLNALLEPIRHVSYTTDGDFEFPGLLVGEPDRHVVWGLTYSFLESFFHVVGSPLPDRWSPEMRRYARNL